MCTLGTGKGKGRAGARAGHGLVCPSCPTLAISATILLYLLESIARLPPVLFDFMYQLTSIGYSGWRPFHIRPATASGRPASKRVHPLYTVLPHCYAPRPPFGRTSCIGLFYLHYTPPPPWATRAGMRYCSSCMCTTCTRVACVKELYSCIKRVENSLRTGLGIFH